MTAISHPLFEQPWPEGDHRLFQVSFFVEDLVGMARRWASVFGVGPFHLRTRIEAPCTYRGVASSVDMQVGVAQAGPVQIELIQQYCDRPSVYRDLGRFGFHQICTVTRDYDGKLAHYQGLGYDLATEFILPDMRVAYFDTVDDFGFFTEVVEETPGYVAHLQAVSRTCALWDGRDPVRLITQDGYRTP
jgi:hypothetical protein